ncbi:MAG: VOC family protein [Elusimicrobiota bacterium]
MNLQNRIGKTYWFDLPVTDVVNARSFYEGLFHWQFLLMSESPIPDYWVIQAGDELIGGIRQTTRERGEMHIPVLYFTVDDLDVYSYRVKELGGKLVGERVDLEKGRGSYQWFFDREKNLVALWAPSKETA